MSQYITIEELKTHAYNEQISAIIREDEDIALISIDIGILYAEGKLSKDYDTEEEFSKTGSDRHQLLVKYIKDIAIWELIGLSSPSIDYSDKKYRYELAISWFDDVYNGMPVKLPRKKTNESSSFKMTSNPKRQNYY